MDRLETLAPKLVQRLRRASPPKQRAAALAACEFAIKKAHLRCACVERALNILRSGGGLSASHQSELEALMSNLDNEYFELQDAAEQGRTTSENYLQKFVQARADSALLFASKDDSFEASSEATHEAAATVNDKLPLFSVVESVL